MYFKKDKNKNSFFKILFVKKYCFILEQKLHNKTSQVAKFLKLKLDFQGVFFLLFNHISFPSIRNLWPPSLRLQIFPQPFLMPSFKTWVTQGEAAVP